MFMLFSIVYFAFIFLNILKNLLVFNAIFDWRCFPLLVCKLPMPQTALVPYCSSLSKPCVTVSYCTCKCTFLLYFGLSWICKNVSQID